ncbi:MAG: HEAT repeat domain-containing protein [Phycisphaerae bacterium]
MSNLRSVALCVTFAAVILCVPCAGRASAAAQDAGEREQKLIAVLRSDAPASEKAITCKRLAVYGSEKAVPALAALLPNPQLASWARIALEAIPGPAADKALRDAMDKVQGRLLVGVINSVAVRRDAKAVDALAARLKDADADVASAAAVALGRIGGKTAVKALEPALAAKRDPVRSAVAQGLIFCAEHCLAGGKRDEAVRLFDAVRGADLPAQRVREATRGAILARGPAGVPLLVEQLRSTDEERFALGLRVARELPGAEATDAVVAELDKAASDRQALIVLALGDRGDPKALPAVLDAVTKGAEHVRTAAMTALERFADASSVPVLLDAAVDDNVDLAQAAKATLARLRGREVDEAIADALPEAPAEKQRILLQIAGQRRIEAALPAMMTCAGKDDAGVRAAAVEAIGALGGHTHAAHLVRIARKTKDAKARAGIEQALMAIASREGPTCMPHLAPLAESDAPALRVIGLHALACAGGTGALDAVRSALDDRDETVRDEAVRTLSGWPGRRPQDDAVAAPLLALAKDADKPAHRVLALRGYLRWVQATGSLGDGERIATVREILPLAARPEEKRLVLAALTEFPHPDGLSLVEPMLGDEAVRGEAELALLAIARGIAGSQRPQARAAAERLRSRAKDDAVRRRAAQLLQKIEKFEDYITAWQVSGPYTKGNAFNTAYTPEKDPAKAEWKILPAGGGGRPWMMDLQAALGGDRRACYVRTYIHSDGERKARLEFGIDDGSKVWLNGKQVHADGTGGAATPGEHKVPVTLRRGWNTLMLKVTQDTGPWQFCLRIRGADGGKLNGLKAQPLPPAK